MQPARIILVFFDGVGLGQNNQNNPFSRFARSFLSAAGGKAFRQPGLLVPTDAHMGVSGLPQSATGQTALFTGVNAAQLAGRHITGFPPVSLRPYLLQHSLLNHFLANQLRASLVNSYSETYLQKIRGPRGLRLMSASTLMQLGSGQPFLTLDDLAAGRSLYMDITGWYLQSQGYALPVIKARQAGRQLVQISRQYELAIYEYFLSDRVGHDQNQELAGQIIADMEGLLEGIWEQLDPLTELAVVCSDHGNLEDLSTAGHTANQVPTLLYGRGQSAMAEKIRSLYDIPRAILDMFSLPGLSENLLQGTSA